MDVTTGKGSKGANSKNEIMNWIPITKELPPVGEIVETKIDDENGVRNESQLKRISANSKLWHLPDGSMYVYYTPTHWRKIEKK